MSSDEPPITAVVSGPHATSNAAAIADELRPRLRPVELSTPKTIHIVGIGGAGMRAIARVLLVMGHHVQGSDRSPSVFVDELIELGAQIFIGHDAAHIAGADLLARSTAVPDENPEVAAALGTAVAVFSRAEILSAIVATRPAILVAGTHGKTTTSSMLAVVLDHGGLDPSFVIGSDVARFATGARWTESPHFVVEADESDGTFLTLPGAHAIVTSLDPDHLEFYGDASRLERCFEAFVDGVDGTTAVCIDDPDTHVLIDRPGVRTYGLHPDADLRLSDVVVTRDDTRYSANWLGADLGTITVGLPGHHNALNSAAAMLIALELGVAAPVIGEALAGFAGVARRMEQRGELLGVRLVDDYAHLPAEVEAAVATATSGSWNRVIAAYQPHRFSRTEALGATFATSFRGVDHLVLTDIYPSGESPRPGVTGRIVYDAVVAACPDLSISWQPSLDDVVDHLAATVGPGDLCLTLGAGDLTTIPDRLLVKLQDRSRVEVDWLVALAANLSSTTVTVNAPIGPLTTYRVGGAARALAQVGSREDLSQVVNGAIATGTPVLPIGRGSNLLIADRGFDGVAIVLQGDFETMSFADTSVKLGAAVSLPAAARQSVAHELRGFEWAVGVPGSLGGAITMNAGGHGSDMAATVTEVTVMDLSTGTISTRVLADLEYGYRTSSIAATDLVLDATMELATGDRHEGEALLSEIVRWRREHQPGGQNAGSVFTNPTGDSAGRLIDDAGGKGLRRGSAVVSDKHANFIQADPGGRADDIYALMQAVVELVAHSTGTILEPETRLVGFD